MTALPPGTFVLFRIASGTTEESFATFLCEHGLEITPEMIDIREQGGNSCMVSIPSAVLCQLLSWAIDNDFLGDRIPLPQPRALRPPQGG
jgi:hypothetical protein